jgi:uncharacterized membrane protein YedE/YeeE
MYITGFVFGCGSMTLLRALEGQSFIVQVIALVVWCIIGSTVNSWVEKHCIRK